MEMKSFFCCSLEARPSFRHHGNSLRSLSAVLSSALGEMAAVRAELLSYFTHVLLGDSLAAEFLLLHLLSSV